MGGNTGNAFGRLGFTMAGRAVGGPLGGIIGSVVGGLIFRDKSKDQVLQRFGPRLQDLSIQTSTYGNPIPIVYGAVRIAGNVIWSTDLVESIHHASESESLGGKGGGPKRVTNTQTFTYSVSYAVALCEGPIVGINRIWADKELLWDSQNPPLNPKVFLDFTLYTGTATQMPDPTLETHLGAGTVPAHRGMAYIVFKDLQLEHFANRIPNLTFEVIQTGNLTIPSTLYATDPERMELDPETGFLWVTSGPPYGAHVVNPELMTAIRVLSFGARPPLGISYQPAYMLLPAAAQEPVIVPSHIWVGLAAPPILHGNLTGWQIDPRTFRPLELHLSGSASWWPGEVLVDTRMIQPTLLTKEPLLLQASVNGLASASMLVISTEEGGDLATLFRQTNWIRDWIVGGEWIYIVDFNGVVTALGAAEEYPVAVQRDLFDTTALSQLAYDPDEPALYVYGPLGGAINLYKLDPITLETIWTRDLGNDSAGVAYHKGYGDIWALESGSPGTLHLLDPSDGSSLVELTLDFAASGITDFFLYPFSPYAFVAKDGVGVYKIQLSAAVNISTITVGEIVADLLERGGLTSSDYDVSTLTEIVSGYIVTSRRPIREAIEPLRQAYFFDLVEIDYQLKGILRGGASVASISLEQVDARLYGETSSLSVGITRGQELEIPSIINVNYVDVNTEYNESTQISQRLISGSLGGETIELPLVLTAAKAKQIADVGLHELWYGRDRYVMTVSREFAALDPSDIVTVEVNASGLTKRLRIVKTDYQFFGVVSFELVEDDASVYAWLWSGISKATAAQSLDTVQPTHLELLDLPMLRDHDNNAGFYAAAGGFLSGWHGAKLVMSQDQGQSWKDLLLLANETTMGFARQVLPTVDSPWTWDRTSSVIIELYTGSLTTSTEELVLQNVNAALLGDELIAFVGAIQLGSTNRYILHTLLRGRNGTESAMTTHAFGDRFILLSTQTMQRVMDSIDELGMLKLYRAVSIGQVLEQAILRGFINRGKGLYPWAPVQIMGSRYINDDLTITWQRRSRFGNGWRDAVDVPLQEEAEDYEVDILASGVVVRTIPDLATKTTLYTAAQQTTDFGSPQASLDVNIYQTSTITGRGFAGSATI